MIIKALALGPFQSNCYILGCEKTGKALIVDPGDDPQRILGELERLSLEPTAYFHTHGHIDHVGGTAGLEEKLGGEILIHEADHFLYESAPEQALTFGIQIPAMAPVGRFIKGGDTVSWGEIQGTIRETPGHSPGGVCLLVSGEHVGQGLGDDGPSPDLVLTGDTLFAGSIGRTDLPGGNHEQLLASIRDQLLTMPDATVVASGHGPLTTIGEERKHNPFLQGL